MIVPAITLLNQSLTWWIIDTVAALLVGLVFALIRWDSAQGERWARERIRYRARLQARQPMPTKADYLEARQDAKRIAAARAGGEIETRTDCTCGNRGICLTCQLAELGESPVTALHKFSERVATDRFARDADRAHGMLESALAGSSAGLRVVR